MAKCDVYIKKMKDRDATIKLVMELYGIKFVDACTIVDAGVVGAAVPEELVDEVVESMEEIGTVTFVTESNYDDEDDDEKVSVTTTTSERKFNVPSLIALIISCISMILAILGGFAGEGGAAVIGFAFIMFIPTFILCRIGFRLVRVGNGRKGFPLAALLLGIGACIGSILFPIIFAGSGIVL